MAVAWALAPPAPALALVQLTQVSMMLALITLAVALLGGAGVVTVSLGVLFRVCGVVSCAWDAEGPLPLSRESVPGAFWTSDGIGA
jgi:hypothetical protein